MTHDPPRVSFCIPAHNEAQLLGRTIHALHDAAATLNLPCEIVVADDGSTDNTGDIATRAGARVVRVEHRKISASRNSAAAASRAPILFFIDADTIVSATNLREALDLLEHGCVGGGALVTFDGRIPLWSRLMLPLVIAGFRMARLSAGCFMFCTREAFEACGGYPEIYYASEEVHFARGLKEVGRFRLIRSLVMTSGRKLRAYSARQVLGVLARGLRSPKQMVRSRDALDLWYGERRDDPWYREG
ncbi:MAG: glycosyltransferase [Phycisphaerales bacterium]|nr:glycosyltransferase [Phycisphaerales bacterium]